MKKINIILSLVTVVLLCACSNDFLDESPTSSQAKDKVVTLDDAELVLNGVYKTLQSSSYYNGAMIMENDVRADDMAAINGNRLGSPFEYDYDAESVTSGLWTGPYTGIRRASQLIDILGSIDVADDDAKTDIKNDFIGQARALRALYHFDLARLFAKQYAVVSDPTGELGIPIVDKVLDPFELLSRNTLAETYTFIVNELETAIPLMSSDIKDGYLNAYGAKTILARVYLYMEEDKRAYDLAVDVINNSGYELISRDGYIDSWSEKFTSESMLSVVNTIDDNGGGNSVGNVSDPNSYGSFGASGDFVDLLSADKDDIRYELLTLDKQGDSLRILKYPGIGNTKDIVLSHYLWDEEEEEITKGKDLKSEALTGSVPVLRLSEVYLIAAEAGFKSTEVNNEDAAVYLDKVSTRGNPINTVTTADLTLDRILLERRKELVAEGHRFFDLIRNKRDIVRVNSEEDGTLDYDDNLVVFPIPQDEINVNENIEDQQNEGY